MVERLNAIDSTGIQQRAHRLRAYGAGPDTVPTSCERGSQSHGTYHVTKVNGGVGLRDPFRGAPTLRQKNFSGTKMIMAEY